jgi:hypothetical protein
VQTAAWGHFAIALVQPLPKFAESSLDCHVFDFSVNAVSYGATLDFEHFEVVRDLACDNTDALGVFEPSLQFFNGRQLVLVLFPSANAWAL